MVSGPDQIYWPETASGVMGQYTAVDPEDEQIRWGLGGYDGDKFTLSDQRELAFHPDYVVDYDKGEKHFPCFCGCL